MCRLDVRVAQFDVCVSSVLADDIPGRDLRAPSFVVRCTGGPVWMQTLARRFTCHVAKDGTADKRQEDGEVEKRIE